MQDEAAGTPSIQKWARLQEQLKQLNEWAGRPHGYRDDR
jgi:hypothetical protein